MSEKISLDSSGRINVLASKHIHVSDINWISDGQPNREKPNPIQPLPVVKSAHQK